MARRRTFGTTWWGEAWIRSLEESRFAHEGRLGRGRTYARQDRVREVELSPGRVDARVWGASLYSTHLGVRLLNDDQWDRLLDFIVAKAVYSAELLAGSMPQGLAADAAAAGSPLLPEPGDVSSHCSCPDDGDPCKHSAALCYVAADLIDTDPFVLMFLRGKDRASMVEELRERRARAAGHTRRTRNDVRAGGDRVDPVEAFAAPPRPLPNALPLVEAPGRPNPLRSSAPADSGLNTAGLEQLAADAARRAWAMLLGESSSALELSPQADLIRRAALRHERHLDPTPILELFDGTAEELEAGAIAWSIAGGPGTTVATVKWTATAEQLAPARSALLEAVPEAKLRKSGNAVHAGSIQLRLDQSGEWWRFEAHDRLGWVLASGPFSSPAEAI
ncbi:MAG: hypothetical protein HKN03_06300 [Acidimicrobiales bacterium]|nr:hypothetical protein [Acidimicrobiales bacterium]